MVTNLFLLILFWTSFYALIHTYIIYALTIWLGSLLRDTQQNSFRTELPRVALIIAAYNEEDIIREKIENSLKLTYPDSKISIIVFSDASSDRTDEIVKEYTDERVELKRIEGRVGKTICQNKISELVDEEILVFSDANSMYEPDAIQNLVQQFVPGIGCVVGELRYRQSSDVEGESVYWRYESHIKRLESQINSLVTGNGSIYAIRADSYVPLSQDMNSDFVEPLEIVRNGELVKYAPNAIAWEDTESSTASELNRRVRIVTRSWNAISNYPDLLNPVRHPLFTYQMLSHKILRWLSPVLLVVVLVANVGLVMTTRLLLYQVLLAGQLAFYMLATGGAFMERLDIESPLLTHIPYYFLHANYGMILGLWNFLQGSNIVVWETSSRVSEKNE